MDRKEVTQRLDKIIDDGIKKILMSAIKGAKDENVEDINIIKNDLINKIIKLFYNDDVSICMEKGTGTIFHAYKFKDNYEELKKIINSYRISNKIKLSLDNDSIIVKLERINFSVKKDEYVLINSSTITSSNEEDLEKRFVVI